MHSGSNLNSSSENFILFYFIYGAPGPSAPLPYKTVGSFDSFRCGTLGPFAFLPCKNLI